MFVSTAPGQELHYEQKVEINTMDGFYRLNRNLNGDKTISWRPHRYIQNSQLTKIKRVPLKYRTRTLANLRDLDTTDNLKSAKKSKMNL